MKRSNVLQLTFVFTGLVFGILSLPYFFSSLIGILSSLISSNGYSQADFIVYNLLSVFAISIQVFVCWLLITRSAKFASWIHKKAKLGSDFSIISKPNDLLHILLIVLGIYLLLSNLSPLLRGIFESFKNKSTSGIQHLYEDARLIDWTPIILNLILPLLLLMFTKPIADYFVKNLSEEVISLEEMINENKLSEQNED